MINYGISYMGSKNSIACKIINVLPKTENFYDLFCGGCCITHVAVLSGKYKRIVFNDIDGDLPKLFIDAIHGKYKHENRWISREDFNRLKDTDAYVRICWSFGNSGKSYLYSKEIEPYKKAWWYAVMFDNYSYLWELGINIPKVKAKDYKDKRLKIKQEIHKHLIKIRQCDREQALERLQSLEALERLQSLQSLNLSYNQVKIAPNSVIYCDIPYENTATYTCGSFNHKDFYNWACKQKELVVISSYEISDDRFQRVVNFKKNSLLQGGCGNKKDEGLFIPKTQIDLWRALKNG